jgi:hypothetical protein
MSFRSQSSFFTGYNPSASTDDYDQFKQGDDDVMAKSLAQGWQDANRDYAKAITGAYEGANQVAIEGAERNMQQLAGFQEKNERKAAAAKEKGAGFLGKALSVGGTIAGGIFGGPGGAAMGSKIGGGLGSLFG